MSSLQWMSTVEMLMIRVSMEVDSKITHGPTKKGVLMIILTAMMIILAMMIVMAKTIVIATMLMVTIIKIYPKNR